MDKILALDIETTGLPAEDKRGNRDFSTVKVLSFGWEVGDRQALHDAGDFHICHTPLPVITEEAQRLHRITPEMLAAGIDPAEAETRIAELFAAYPVIAGQNLFGFDLPILSVAFGVEPGPDALILDTRLLWKAFSLGMRCMPGESLEFFYGRVYERRDAILTSLEHICAFFQISYAGAHQASFDASITAEVLRRMSGNGILRSVLGIDW